MRKPANTMRSHSTTQENARNVSAQYSSSDCDDCVICRGMKKAEEEGRELSLEELQALFQKQNTQH